MKKILLSLTIAIFCLQAFAQDDNDNPNTTVIDHYMFNNFIPGTVKKKSGEKISAALNYNTLKEEMVFMKDSVMYTLMQLEDIDTVYLAGRTFVPNNNFFYEKATNTPVALYIEHKTTVLSPSKDLGYGIKSQLGSAVSPTQVAGGNRAFNLKQPDDYKPASRTTYWLNKDGKYVQLHNFKNVQDAFPARADAIKEFVKTNKLKFGSEDDMIKLINFCNQPI